MNSTNGKFTLNCSGASDNYPLHTKISELTECNKILAQVNLNNAGKIAGLENKLNEIEMQINKHRTWTGIEWEQNPLAVFVANKILAIISGEY